MRRVKMKLSSETIDVLKNFSNINQNILIKEGDTVRTMSTMKNILASAKVKEEFGQEFGIYDLTEFLGVMSLVGDPELEFDNDSFLTINGNGSANIKYFFSDPSILTTPPDSFNAPDCDVSFAVSGDILSSVLKGSAVMQLPDVVFSGVTGSVVKITTTDLKNTTSNEFTQELSENTTQEFKFHYKADNLKMIPGDYDVSVSTEALVSNWKNSHKDISYWIALEQPSD